METRWTFNQVDWENGALLIISQLSKNSPKAWFPAGIIFQTFPIYLQIWLKSRWNKITCINYFQRWFIFLSLSMQVFQNACKHFSSTILIMLALMLFPWYCLVTALSINFWSHKSFLNCMVRQHLTKSLLF